MGLINKAWKTLLHFLDCNAECISKDEMKSKKDLVEQSKILNKLKQQKDEVVKTYKKISEEITVIHNQIKTASNGAAKEQLTLQ